MARDQESDAIPPPLEELNCQEANSAFPSDSQTIDMMGLLGIALISVDASHNIMAFEGAATAIFGYEPNEIVGQSLEALIPDRFREHHRVHFDQFMADRPQTRRMDDRLDVEIVGMRKDGSEFYGEASISNEVNSQNSSVTVFLRDISARKAMEREVLHRQEQYRLMVESVSHAVFRVDTDGLFTYLNPRCYDLTGYTTDELIGQHFTVIVASKSKGEVNDFYSKQKTEGMRETVLQFPIETKSGEQKWVEQTVAAEVVNNKVQGFQAIAYDITERLEAEKSLVRAEAENRILAEENGIIAEIARVVGSAIDFGKVIKAFAEEYGKLIGFDQVSIGLLDESEKNIVFAYVSDPREEQAFLCEEIHAIDGVSSQVVTGKKGAIIVNHEQFPQLKSAGIFNCKEEFQFCSALLVPIIWNHRTVGVLATASQESDAFSRKDLALAERVAYQVAGALANGRLYAEWQQTQQDLLLSEEFHRSMLDNHLDGVILVVDGNVQYANPAICQLSGFLEEQLVGRHASELISADDQTKAAKRLDQLTRGGTLIPVEYTMLKKNGGTLPIEVASQPIRIGEQQGYLSVFRDITWRKKVERALADAEQKYRDLVENAVMGIYQSIPDGGFVRANNALVEMLGYDSFEDLTEGIVGIGDHMFADQEYRHEITRQLCMNGLVSGFECEAYRKDGSTVWISISARSIKDEEGNVVTYEGTIEDITARKRAEEALQEAKSTLEVTVAERTVRLREANKALKGELVNRHVAEVALQESERRSRSIIEAIPDLIFRINRSGILLDYVVPDDLISLRPESWLNSYIEGVVPVEFAREMMKHVKRALSTEKVQTFEHTLHMPLLDGGLRELEGRIVVNGEDEVLAIVRDITETKEAQRSSERQAREREVLGDIGRLVGSTLEVEAIYKKFAEEVRKLIPFERLTVQAIDTYLDTSTVIFVEGAALSKRAVNEPFKLSGSVIESTIRGRSSLLMRGDQQDDADKYAQLEAVGAEHLNQKKSLLAVPLISRDVVIGALVLRSNDDEMYGERELALIERLGDQMASAMANSQDAEERRALEDQLAQSQKMEVIGQLAGGVAHDFNNFLTPIMGYSHLAVVSEGIDERIKNYMEEVYDAAERASNLTNQLLAFSRRQIIEPKIVDLNSLISNMESMLRTLIGEEIELTFTQGDQVGCVRVDAGQIEQVLANLAANARDAMPDGGSLHIETGQERVRRTKGLNGLDLTPGTYVVLKVSDTGTGMPNNVKERIFEPFFTTKDVGKGTGLGLSTCYGIIKQNSGDLVVETELGKGTQFKIYLPHSKEAPTAIAPREKVSSVEGGTETVLLVEDEPVVRKIAHSVLTDRGYNVLQAENGDEALKMMDDPTNSAKIDILLTDVVMPHMGGRELAELFAGKCPAAKVLYMSGYTDDAIDHHGVLEEGIQLLRKPFTPTVLAHKVRDLLDS